MLFFKLRTMCFLEEEHIFYLDIWWLKFFMVRFFWQALSSAVPPCIWSLSGYLRVSPISFLINTHLVFRILVINIFKIFFVLEPMKKKNILMGKGTIYQISKKRLLSDALKQTWISPTSWNWQENGFFFF